MTGTHYLTLLISRLKPLAHLSIPVGSSEGLLSDSYGLQGHFQDSHRHPLRMFEFLHLPFGLRNAGNTFQRMMDQILGNLSYCFVYIDDIIVFSPDLTTHVQNL